MLAKHTLNNKVRRSVHHRRKMVLFPLHKTSPPQDQPTSQCDPDSRSKIAPRENLQSECQSHSWALTDRMVMQCGSHNPNWSWLATLLHFSHDFHRISTDTPRSPTLWTILYSRGGRLNVFGECQTKVSICLPVITLLPLGYTIANIRFWKYVTLI